MDMDIFSWVVFLTLFLTCFTLLVAGIVDAVRDGKRIDERRKSKETQTL